MRTAVLLLAAAGFLAVALRAGLALLVVLRRGVEGVLARDVEEIHARRGDLTRLEDAVDARALVRRRRVVALSLFTMWAGLLVVPPLTPWPSFLYAAYSLLWLVPRRTRLAPRP
jgi:hypothetical protein